MYFNIKSYIKLGSCVAALTLGGCNDFLDRTPLDQVTPDQFFNNASDLAAYAINNYSFSTHEGYGAGIGALDNHTDNQASASASTSRWVPGEWRVPSYGGGWDFSAIRRMNFFFQEVLPKHAEGKIGGVPSDVNHYIGEMYFLRAWNYFGKLQSIGDFPIVKTVLEDNKEALIEASKRRPRNEVARFIISDLDSAIMLMSNNPNGGKNRLTKNAALLIKSRVALYEGSWLKHHKGTANVPGGPGWPGAKAEYLKDFTIDIDAEINYFLTEAMNASKELMNNVQITEATDVVNPTSSHNGWNPYFEMFVAEDMEDISEVLLWRKYDGELGIAHGTRKYLITGGANTGYTKSLMESFLMKNGLPIYAAGSGYKGDVTIENEKADRDLRMQLFVGGPSDVVELATAASPIRNFGVPPILEVGEAKSPTGYSVRKFLSYDPSQDIAANNQTYGCPVFRASEGMLNYIEACYLKTNSIDGTADQYWRALRRRAKVDENYTKTINATDLSKERDWAVYSNGVQVDPTLYNIRRERRNEFIGEGLRWADLKRWRALDQVQGYQIEGFNLWGEGYKDSYNNESGESLLVPTGTTGTPNVSSPDASTYLRPYQIASTNNMFVNGYFWRTCNYLEPIAQQHFMITSSNPSVLEESVIYQNPGWPYAANQPGSDL